MTGPNSLRVGDRELRAAAILIATGARPQVPDVPGAEHAITSNEAFHLDAVPRRIVIAGGGYIANEFAGIFHQFGAEVTLLNRSDRILRGYDEQIRDRLLQISLTKGIRFQFNTTLQAVTKNDDGTLTLALKDARPLHCDALMFATGRVPNTAGLGLEQAGVELDSRPVPYVSMITTARRANPFMRWVTSPIGYSSPLWPYAKGRPSPIQCLAASPPRSITTAFRQQSSVIHRWAASG